MRPLTGVPRTRPRLLALLLPALLLLPVCHAFIPPTVSSSLPLLANDKIGEYIEIQAGDDLQMNCTDVSGEAVWQLPADSGIRGFDAGERDSRVSLQLDQESWGHTLLLKNAKPQDSGRYLCHKADDDSIHTPVHLFVHEGNSFLPASAAGLSVSSPDFVVPCLASKLTADGSVELQVNGETWTTLTSHYDPTVGFKITPANAEKAVAGEMTYKCVHKPTGDTLTFLIAYNKNVNTDELEIVWSDQTAWPYVGGEFLLDCSLRMKDGSKLQNRFKYHLNITCPRCGDSSAVLLQRQSGHSLHSKLLTKIATLTPEDSGEYRCQWYYETDLVGSIETHVDVSPKKGQIKVISKTLGPVSTSPERLSVPVGQDVTLFAEIHAFPADLPEYHTEWRRKYRSLPQVDEENEAIVNDNEHVVHSDKNDGSAIEKLIVKSAKTEISGVYSLTVKVLDTVRTIEWVVDVVNEKIDARIDITSQSNWVLFDQKYYKAGTKVRLYCVVKAMPSADVTFLRRSSSSQPWLDVERAELTAMDGTYESGLMWNTTVDDDLHVKCQGDRDGISNHEEKLLRISDTNFEVDQEVIKSTRATSTENPNDIYEGDDVLLKCFTPPEKAWTVKWLFRNSAGVESEVNATLDQFEGHSRVFTADVRNANSGNSGSYVCVISDAGKEKEIGRTIFVQKTTVPYVHQPDEETTKVIKYGEHTNITCPLEGSPKPDYRWFKDNVEITDSEMLSVNAYENKVLNISRVVAEDQGEYRCEATNRAGSASYKIDTKVEGAPKRFSALLLSGILLLLLLICGCVIAAFLKQNKRAKEQERALQVLYDQLMRATEQPPPQLAGPKQPLDQRINQIQYDRGFEVDSSNLQIGNRLGTGQFGQVWMGWLSKPRRVDDQAATTERLPVAVKGPLNSSNPQHHKMLAEELKIMSAIGTHPNVLSLIGAVTKNMSRGELYMIVEMCDGGNLKDFLQKYKSRGFVNELRPAPAAPDDGYLQPNSVPKMIYASEQSESWSSDMEQDRLLEPHDRSVLATSDLLSFAMQVANGMDYLASIPCIHRDLAARNVLITSNRVARVADFGMARSDNKNYYKMRKSRDVALPVRWMSIEAIEDGLYTQESDVWSFGILLYEMFTLGSNPYPTIANEDILQKLKDGHRNTRPQYCHDHIYQLMQRCWEANPAERPTFAQCLGYLKEHLKTASPQLLQRLELLLRAECDKQASYSSWRDGQDEQTNTLNGFATPSTSRQEEEHIYMPEFHR